MVGNRAQEQRQPLKAIHAVSQSLSDAESMSLSLLTERKVCGQGPVSARNIDRQVCSRSGSTPVCARHWKAL